MIPDFATAAIQPQQIWQKKFAKTDIVPDCRSGKSRLMANRIKEMREQRGVTQEQLAEMVEPQTSAAQISKLESGKLGLKLDWMVRIARALGCEPEDLITKRLPLDPLPGGEAARGPKVDEPNRLDMLPVRSAARGGPDQEMFLGDPIDHVPRPHYLKNVRDAYSVYTVGWSMVPMYRPGQLLYVNPHKPPQPGRGVVVTKQTDAVVIKEFVREMPDGSIELREYQPKPRTFTVRREEIRHIHAVVGSEEP
ncbi:MAG TPA: helix-turn-helix domain-containing protein [Pararhizobium sp.]|nr:helix-turn-helix domain-containing protein [Pararhizobium sp.]